MADIIPIRHRDADSPWRLIIIQQAYHGTALEIVAWTGAPDDPGVDRMFCGSRLTLLEAATFARGKAAQLGIVEIVDFTDAEPGPGEAA